MATTRSGETSPLAATKVERYLWPVGIVLSVGLGIFLFFVTQAHLVHGTIVTMVGIVITQLMDLLVRVERRAQKQDSHSRLMEIFDEVPWLGDTIKNISASTGTIIKITWPEQLLSRFRST